ncbi:MAG: DUF11 domain-containing protein [Armatimonadetes bacterium]|nr:DUF11 domain-containing protein [Armatimonadota bacterium]
MGIKTGGFLALLAVLACGPALSAPSIGNLSDNTSAYPNGAVPKHERFELTFTVSNVGTAFSDYNPFNPNVNELSSNYWDKKGIRVDAVITSPSGRTVYYPCFWYDNGSGWTGWKLRFAPTETGTWKYYIYVKHSSGAAQSAGRTFSCASSSNHGFVRVRKADPRMFEFTDGTVFYPTGVCSATTSVIPKLAAKGGNFTRFFYSSLSLEPYSDRDRNLNNYSMGRCRTIDDIMSTAQQHGVYVQWLLDDWTYVKGNKFAYISSSYRPAPCSDVGAFAAGSNRARELYKRKLRYFHARWAAYTSLMSIEFINELDLNSSDWKNWHIDMGNFVHGASGSVPSEWNLTQDLNARPLMATSSNGSGWMDDRGVPWDNPAMDYFNQHDYAKFTLSWTGLGGAYNYDTMGSAQHYPWEDASVWMDRWGRAFVKNYTNVPGWKKPHCVTEFGLIYRRPGDSGFPDWGDAYNKDTTARHFRDSLWAALFRYMAMTHWKTPYIDGTYGGGGEKYWIFKPLKNFLQGVDLTGLHQETAYPGYATSNRLECSNKNVQAMVLAGTNKAYLYVKNLTDSWYRLVNDSYHSSSPPTPSTQSATVKIRGLQPGTYTVEKWDTVSELASNQKKSTTTATVGSDGVLTLSISVGTGTTSGYDWAYKIYSANSAVLPPEVVLSLDSDKTKASPGETVTYSVTYQNTGTGAASNLVIAVPVPTATTYVTASAGGSYSSTTKKVSWTIPSVAAGAAGKLTFQVKVN